MFSSTRDSADISESNCNSTGDPRLSTFLGVMKALGIKLKPRAA